MRLQKFVAKLMEIME